MEDRTRLIVRLSLNPKVYPGVEQSFIHLRYTQGGMGAVCAPWWYTQGGMGAVCAPRWYTQGVTGVYIQVVYPGCNRSVYTGWYTQGV